MGYHSFAFRSIVIATGFTVLACAPSPKYTPCSNDGDCTKAGERYPYCMQSRCVECVSRASCNGNACDDGVCHIRCEDARDCLHGDACNAGTCEPT